MLRNLLHFGEQTAGDICVTRGDIMAVPRDISFEDLVRAFADAGHSRLPVYGESLDEVIGMVHIKDVFMANVDPSRDRSMDALMREPLFVPESMGVIELLARMRSQRIHLAIVVDEFGGTEGLVTIEDVVEEIVGEIEDEHDEAEAGMLTMLDDGVWEADARLELEELAQAVDARLSSEEDEVDTLGGLVFLLAGHIPAERRMRHASHRDGSSRRWIPIRAGSSGSAFTRPKRGSPKPTSSSRTAWPGSPSP